LPLFLLCLSRPVLLIGGIISFVFVCLQSSDQLQNICMQYQADILALVFINSVFALEKLNQAGERDLPLLKFLAASPGRSSLAAAALAGTIATSLLAFYFFGQSVIGKNSYGPILDRRSWGNEISQIKALVPEKVPLNATMDLAGHFILRNEVYPQFKPLQNYVLMDLNTKFADKKEMDQLRREMLAGGCKVIYSKANQGKHLVLFAKTASTSLSDDIFTLKSEEEWNQCGDAVEEVNPDFKVKASQQDRIFKLYIRPAARLKYDVNIILTLGNQEEFAVFNNTFGNGVTPAFNCGPDQVFVMAEELPEGWNTFDKYQIKIIPRPTINEQKNHPDEK